MSDELVPIQDLSFEEKLEQVSDYVLKLGRCNKNEALQIKRD